MAPRSDDQTSTVTATSALMDSSNPYYLHPSDSPGMVLVNSLFNGKGYAGWSRAIVIALSAKNKLGFIDGIFTPPTAGSNQDIWKELETRFGQCNGAQLYQLQKELSDAVQGASDIAGYFIKVKKIWDKLDALNTFDHCSCTCICGGKVKTLKSHQDGRLIQFLMGLNEAYSGVKSSILMMDPLPSVHHAYSLLIQDEKQREIHVSVQHPSEAAFMVSTQKFNGGQKPANNQKFTGTEGRYKPNFDKQKGGKYCTYCKMTNHVVGNCYRLIGFPPDFKFTKGKRFQATAHSNASAVESDSNNTQSVQDLGNTSTGNVITQEQLSQLFQLLQEVKVGQQSGQISDANVCANCAVSSHLF
ncbi:PREDICTED: uncharacterized protein LOC109224181 [Nicotiana attenuata]|uniref:uncharacterized protein LOC109224181 n=1 Tax=Nicotiana attenuata TaxID=49451 RepID=UPI000905A12C|nr:PREDICTED: uncharacterized protein LOC109224181 [Nicotiana attenuata]